MYNFDRNKLCEMFDGELVGGNVSAVVDGRKEYITKQEEDGRWHLTPVGERLVKIKIEVAELEKKPKSKTKE